MVKEYPYKVINHPVFPYEVQRKGIWFWSSISSEMSEAEAREDILILIQRDEATKRLNEEAQLAKIKAGAIINITDEDITVWKLQGKL
jgi:hypothetical protein